MAKKRKFETPEELEKKIEEYFRMCDEKKKPYTITGLALALDTSRETLLDYEHEEKFKFYSDAIKKAKLRCQNYAEEQLFSAKNVAGIIFNLKNNYGWKDAQITELTGKDGGPLEILIEKVPGVETE